MMRSLCRALFVASILVLVCTAGCGKREPSIDPSVGKIKPVPESKAESGWPLYEVPAEGFALALPPDWRQFDMNPKTFEASYSETIKQNPELKDMLEGIRQQVARGIKFFGVHVPTMRTGFATNVNVLRVPLPSDATLDMVVDVTLKEYDAVASVTKPIEHERVKLPGGDSERFHVRMAMQNPTGKMQPLVVTQFVFVKGTDHYTVTLTTLPDRENQMTDTFDKIGQSFRFIKK